MTAGPRYPCGHAASKHVHRVSSHTDEEADAAGGVSKLTDAFASVWVCDRPGCIEAGKQWVAWHSLRTPVMLGRKSAVPRD